MPRRIRDGVLAFAQPAEQAAPLPGQPPITPEKIAALPPDFQALLRAAIDYDVQRIAALEAEAATSKATHCNSLVYRTVGTDYYAGTIGE